MKPVKSRSAASATIPSLISGTPKEYRNCFEAEYVVQFDASSTVARSFEVTVENAGYYRYLSEVVEVGPETKTFTLEFTMTDTDMTAMKFLMGKTAGSPIGAHDIVIDNVSITLQ